METSPMPNTTSVAPLIRPTVVAIFGLAHKVGYYQVLRCDRGVTMVEIPGHKILARARGELCGPEKAL